MDRKRVTVQQAAATLGVTEQAIRKRVKRGSIGFDKDHDGRVYVYLDAGKNVTDESRDDVPNPHNDALISQMQDRIDSLERSLEAEREANRENRRLLAAALEGERQRALEPREPSEDRPGGPPETPEGVHHQGEPQSAGEQARVPWWRRLLGG